MRRWNLKCTQKWIIQGASTNPMEFSLMFFCRNYCIVMLPAQCGQQFDKQIFRTRDGSSTDVGQVEVFWYVAHIKGPKINVFRLPRITHWCWAWFIVVCPSLSVCVTASATSDRWDLFKTFILQNNTVIYCRILSEIGFPLNTNVSKIGFPLSMQIAQLLENWS